MPALDPGLARHGAPSGGDHGDVRYLMLDSLFTLRRAVIRSRLSSAGAAMGVTGLLVGIWLLTLESFAQDVGIAGGLACTYPSIAVALAAAPNGGVLLVREGATLTENIVVNKSIAIVGGDSSCMSSAPLTGVRPTIQAAAAGSSTIIVQAGVDLTLSHVAIKGGDNVGGNGGNLRLNGNNHVSIYDTIISGGRAAVGGGIYVENSTLELWEGTVLTENTASANGGGIAAFDSAVLLWQHLNPAPPEPPKVIRNTAGAGGGGIYLNNAATNLQGYSEITANEADEGAGIFSEEGGTIFLVEAIISNNTASSDGGGIFAAQCDLLRTYDATVSGNFAGNAGGGVYFDGGAIDIGESTVFASNIAIGDGAGFALRNATAPINSALIHGTWESNAAGGAGGAIDILATAPSIAVTGGLTASGNSSRDGGALSLRNGASWSVAGRMQIDTNSATGSGGGVYIEHSSFRASGVADFENNSASRGGGLAINCEPGPSSVTLGAAPIIGNIATERGGGLAVWNGASGACAVDTTFALLSGNSATVGGGVALWGATAVTMKDPHVVSNSALQDGGGIALVDDGTAGVPTLTVEAMIMDVEAGTPVLPGCAHDLDTYCSELRDNTANRGGAVFASDGILTLRRSVVIGNDAATQGAGIYLASTAPNVSGYLNSTIVEANGASPTVSAIVVGNQASLIARYITVGDNPGDALRYEAGSLGELSFSAIADTPIFVDPSRGALAGDCNAVHSVSGALSGSYDTGLLASDFPGGSESRWQLSGAATLLVEKCAGAPTDRDVGRDSRDSNVPDRGAYDFDDSP